MRANGADLKTLQVFGLRIKTSIYKSHSFLLVEVYKAMTLG